MGAGFILFLFLLLFCVNKLTGIAFNHLGRIERGKYNVTLDTLAVVINALGMDLELIDK